jgi:hypothetical protein
MTARKLAAPTYPRRVNDNGSDGGTYNSGDVDEDGVESDGVAEQGLAHKFGYERLAGGIIDSAEDSEDYGEHEHLPEAHLPGENGEAEKKRDTTKADLGDKEHPALVEAIDEQASIGAQQQDRSIAGCGCQSEQESRMGELKHQESLSDGLDPGSDQGQTLASDIAAKIADGESGAELMEPPIWFECRRHGSDGFQVGY